jgi:hypothetical protein
MEKLHDKSQGAYRPIPLHGFRPPQPPDNWPYHNYPTTPHDREFGIKNPKFERHIFIDREQILFDIDSQIAMVNNGKRKEDGTEDDTRANATTTYQQEFYRWIDKYIGKAKSVMSAFVLEQFKTTKMNAVSQKEEVDITLLVPEWYDDTVFDQLCDAVHEYVVNAALYEYFALTLSIKDPVTVTKKEMMDDAKNEVRKYVNASKPGSVRKPQNPF